MRVLFCLEVPGVTSFLPTVVGTEPFYIRQKTFITVHGAVNQSCRVLTGNRSIIWGGYFFTYWRSMKMKRFFLQNSSISLNVLYILSIPSLVITISRYPGYIPVNTFNIPINTDCTPVSALCSIVSASLRLYLVQRYVVLFLLQVWLCCLDL